MASPRKAHLIVNGQSLCGRSNTQHEDRVANEDACKVCVKRLKVEKTIKCKECGKKIRGVNHNLGDHHMKVPAHKNERSY